jgi:hypothetical protein
MNIPQVLNKLYPDGANWMMIGTEYSGLNWREEGIEIPSLELLEATWETMEEERIAAEKDIVAARESAVTKLANLGLTPDEIVAIIGTPPTSPVVP